MISSYLSSSYQSADIATWYSYICTFLEYILFFNLLYALPFLLYQNLYFITIEHILFHLSFACIPTNKA